MTLLPTANDLLAAITGDHPKDPILDAADAMHPVQQGRYMSLGIAIGTSIWPISKVQNAAAQFHAATDELAYLVDAIDMHVAENIPLHPAINATLAEQTIGEHAAYLAYRMVEVWAEKVLNRDAGHRAALDRACDAYEAFRAALLAGETRLPDRHGFELTECLLPHE